ncbi:hypothetical protein P3342_005270 [Pyrenophora teres f. teres]|nr:hypothetical protein HRS9139_00763 [Pyrenophora teres f. teres]KAE8848336.1 hypothetical protein PTNB85_02179 [Pyrenophora teres f. teres]KAE8853498.1 hypothetical protein HRS9122_00490 [Pyrenophora teres f. teres]KAE8868261.1 hypothetical protein PTNB29_02172 [Pyrenophora teres f. teres]KAE8873027.1 hypothetical protein PTNB73_02178 [Pyrenophora teres f. teres]
MVNTYTDNLKADYDAHYKDILVQKEKLDEKNKATISRLVNRVSELEDQISYSKFRLSYERIGHEWREEEHAELKKQHSKLEKEHAELKEENAAKKDAAGKLETIQKQLLCLVKDLK